MHLGIAGERRVDVTLQQHGWWWTIPVAHGDVMASCPETQQVSEFLAISPCEARIESAHGTAT